MSRDQFHQKCHKLETLTAANKHGVRRKQENSRNRKAREMNEKVKEEGKPWRGEALSMQPNGHEPADSGKIGELGEENWLGMLGRVV